MTVALNYKRINCDPSVNPARGSGLISLSPPASGAAVNPARCNIVDQPFDADATLYVAAMSVEPILARRELINQLFLDLKGLGNHGSVDLFSLLDAAWIFAAHDQQAARLDIKRAFDATEVGTPAWTVDQGFVGSSGNYLRSNFTPSADGVNYTLNDASLGAYLRDDAAIAAVSIGGAGLTGSSAVNPRWTTNNQLGAVNQDPVTSMDRPNADSLGLSVSRRTAAAVCQLFRNGVSIEGEVDASDALTPVELYILAFNNNGVAANFETREVAFAFVGAALSVPDQLNLFNAIEDYLDAIGAGVVA